MKLIDSLWRAPALARRLSLPAVALMLASALALGAAGWTGYRWLAGHEAQRGLTEFQALRIGTIQAQLDQVEGRYIVVMGDSHAERLFLPSLCGLAVVNAGISGATVGDVVAAVRALAPRRKAEAVLLSVGTNDIWSKRNPGTKAAEDRFQAGLAELGRRLAAWTDRRALIAIPPVAVEEQLQFPRQAAQRYSAILSQSCGSDRCAFIDLFSEASTLERGKAFSDGVHMRDYAHFVRGREAEICGRLGLETAAQTARR